MMIDYRHQSKDKKKIWNFFFLSYGRVNFFGRGLSAVIHFSVNRIVDKKNNFTRINFNKKLKNKVKNIYGFITVYFFIVVVVAAVFYFVVFLCKNLRFNSLFIKSDKKKKKEKKLNG